MSFTIPHLQNPCPQKPLLCSFLAFWRATESEKLASIVELSISELSRTLEITDSIVTIDAMGAQSCAS